MNYELAKRLKDAGFPDLGYEHYHYLTDEKGENKVFNPTLSNLIDACDREFRTLTTDTKVWLAIGLKNLKTVSTQAESAEEAVAELWLALNQK